MSPPPSPPTGRVLLARVAALILLGTLGFTGCAGDESERAGDISTPAAPDSVQPLRLIDISRQAGI